MWKCEHDGLIELGDINIEREKKSPHPASDELNTDQIAPTIAKERSETETILCTIMDYLVRFAQIHETFRQPELQACATLAGADLEILSYDEYV